MALFNFGKKKEEKKPCCCSCSCEAQASVTEEATCCGEAVEGICCIKVLGAGCKSCHDDQYENAKTAVANMGLSVEVEYITDMEKVMSYGVMSMPAIIVNEKVAVFGKVLKVAEVETLLRKYL